MSRADPFGAVPVIGYDRAAAIAKRAYKQGRTIRELVLEEDLLPADELARILDPWPMTEPGFAAKGE